MKSLEATVTTVSRRWIQILTPDLKALEARTSTKALDITVGDTVRYQALESDNVIDTVVPRKNELRRVSGPRSKTFAANVDLLIIVAGVGPLFNHGFIDRALVSAAIQSIPALLVVNKCDLPHEEINSAIDYYGSLCQGALRTSVKESRGLDPIIELLQSPELGIVALCGLSGVGKSSILNHLIPQAERATGQVSDRTGQGRQTTSQSVAYPYRRSGIAPLLVIDLPGFQQFGLTHLTPREVSDAFPEFLAAQPECQYNDCLHLNEPVCGVQARLKDNRILASRYESYREILKDIEAARPY